ncbi:hypothetical protein, partial [Sinorhizobium meliloti]|uniref:hypothetical protein n=1 Tax=Rhizobium meliloti TaxID=382 RepID=UPI001AECDE74
SSPADPTKQGARSSRKPGAQSSRNKGAASSESAVDIEGTFFIENSGHLSVAGNQLIDLLLSPSGDGR